MLCTFYVEQACAVRALKQTDPIYYSQSTTQTKHDFLCTCLVFRCLRLYRLSNP
jgi:hypothetical protein